MNEVTKQKLKKNLTKNAIHYWYVIVIMLFFSASVFLWQRGESKQKVIDQQAATLKVAATVQDIEAKLADLKKREAELYPQLAKKLADLNKTEAEIVKQRKEITNARKDKIAKQVDKMDLDALSVELSHMGFPDAVVRK